MRTGRHSKAFSLMEVLIAVAILTIGLVMVGVTFPAGASLTSLTAERSIAAVVAEEAFAKIKLYGIDLNNAAFTPLNWPSSPDQRSRLHWVLYDDVVNMPQGLTPEQETLWQQQFQDQFAYPSDPAIPAEDKVYFWSALTRKISDNQVLVTVFVNRVTNARTARFPAYLPPNAEPTPLYKIPKPILIYRDNNNDSQFTPPGVDLSAFTAVLAQDRALLQFQPAMVNPKNYFVEGAYLVDDETAQVHRIMQKTSVSNRHYLHLDRPLTNKFISANTIFVWMVPPAVGTSRNPCIAVYQRVLTF